MCESYRLTVGTAVIVLIGALSACVPLAPRGGSWYPNEPAHHQSVDPLERLASELAEAAARARSAYHGSWRHADGRLSYELDRFADNASAFARAVYRGRRLMGDFHQLRRQGGEVSRLARRVRESEFDRAWDRVERLLQRLDAEIRRPPRYDRPDISRDPWRDGSAAESIIERVDRAAVAIEADVRTGAGNWDVRHAVRGFRDKLRSYRAAIRGSRNAQGHLARLKGAAEELERVTRRSRQPARIRRDVDFIRSEVERLG